MLKADKREKVLENNLLSMILEKLDQIMSRPSMAILSFHKPKFGRGLLCSA